MATVPNTITASSRWYDYHGPITPGPFFLWYDVCMLPDNVHVMIAVPTMGDIHANLAALLIQWTQRYRSDQITFYFTFRVAPVDRARNQVVEQFFKATPAKPFTHLFFIDADTVPPIDALERLIAHDKAIVSGLTPIPKFTEDGGWYLIDNCFMEGKRDEHGKILETHIAERGTGLQPIFRCGTSCLLIKREVLETVPRPHFVFEYNDAHTLHTRSEDIRFCDNARAAGFELYADTDVMCGHEKSLMIR